MYESVAAHKHIKKLLFYQNDNEIRSWVSHEQNEIFKEVF